MLSIPEAYRVVPRKNAAMSAKGFRCWTSGLAFSRLLCAKLGGRRIHSITSSASASRVGGTMIPSAFAVLRLTAVSNFVG